MKSNIFIPKTIKVGYDKRTDTYTGQLAYIIYIDAKGKVRKEASWTSWRDKKIAPNDYANEPTSGFVLNKKVGGYSSGWDHRQTYARVYDPRGFEFEITIPNLLYILENTSAIKGKGLEGDFVYGWDGKDLLLMPTSAPDYADLTAFAEASFNREKITSKNIILGATYQTSQNENWIYLGRFEEYETSSWGKRQRGKSLGKKYWFKKVGEPLKDGINKIGGLSRIIKTIDSTPSADYAAIMDVVEKREDYSAYAPDKDVLIRADLAKIKKKLVQKTAYGYSSKSMEICLSFQGVDLLATIMTESKSFKENPPETVDENSIKFFIYSVARRFPLAEDKYERRAENPRYHYYYGGNYHKHQYEDWEQDYDNGGYKLDRELDTIKQTLQKNGLMHGRYDGLGVSLEELDNQVQLYTRKMYLTNGKLYKEETY